MRRVLLAALLLGVGLVALVRDVPGLNTAWFLFAWVAALLLFDAGISQAGGASFLGPRRRELLAMLAASVPYWCLFEAWNLLGHNWFYVFVPATAAGQAALAGAAFATVLPACFLPAELLRTHGAFEGVRWSPLRLTPLARAWIAGFGVACVVLPLVVPRLAYPLVWGATLGLPALANHHLTRPGGPREGGASLLRDLEAGRPARLLRLLAGGLIAGGLWEGLNVQARTKWVYTVPGLEETKLFEMPLLGFLGFPALAVQAFSAWTLWSHLARGGRSYQETDAANALRRPGRAGRRAQMAAVVVFSGLCSLLTLEGATASRRPLLADLGALAPALRGAGISSPERLEAAAREHGIPHLAAHTGIPAGPLTDAVAFAGLALHKGLGSENARRLQRCGVNEVGDLAEASPDRLLGCLERQSEEEPPCEAALCAPTPTGPQVRVWIHAAPEAGPFGRR